MPERGSPMNKSSRSGSLTSSEFSVKVVGHINGDDQLIGALVKRISSKLSFGNDPVVDKPDQLEDEVLRQTTHTLEQLSRFRINRIVEELIKLLDDVSTRRPSARDGGKIPAPNELVRDASLILKIIAGCMQSHWNYCKENYPEADITDPGLDHQVAQSIFRISIFYAYQSVDHDSPDEIGRVAEQLSREMAKSATDIIRYISASNWSVCNAIWKSYLQNCSNAEARMEIRPLRMIENMSMDLECLMSVIKDLAVFGFLPKRAQDVIAVSLRKAIVSWIDENPKDFIKLHSKDGSSSYGPDQLFDIIMGLPESNSRRETLWPLAMTLLLLCPDIALPAVHAALSDSRAKNDVHARVRQKVTFLDNVRKCLKIDGLAEYSAICMTDFAKAVYLLPRTENDLVRYVAGNDRELSALVFDPTSRIYKHNKDRGRLSQLVYDRLVAVYRANRKEFVDIAINKAYDPTSNTYITFNMSRFCREHIGRTNVQLHTEEFEVLYPRVAPKIRRQLEYLLKSYSPGSPISSDRPTKGAPPIDKADLIVEMLRNYMENIDAALTGTRLDHKHGMEEDTKVIFDETQILESIVEASVASKHEDIAKAGADFVELIYSPKNAWRWAEYAKLNPDGHLFWQYPLALLMVQKVINANIEREVALQAMQQLQVCYSNVIAILMANKDLIRQGIFSPDNIDYLNNVETALLISLCSSNLNISKVAVSLFQQLHEMSVLAVEVCGDELTTMKPHFEMYDRLSSISLVVSSRLAIQKAFRKALSQIRQPTFSITAALGTAFEERDRLSKHLNTPLGTRKLVGSRLMEADMINTDWINYSGFLASLGGCWYTDAHAKEPGEIRSRSVSLTKSEIDTKNQLKMFLKDQCRYLASESGILRETVSRMLSTDLSPRLFGLLFEQLDDITSSLFDTKGQPVCKDNNTLFVDQAVMLLKGLVDRITEPVDIPPYVDFGGILSSFCEYLERLGRDPVKLQIKVKMCMLCELVAAKRDVLNLKQEARLMNNLLDHIHQWASESETSKTDVTAMPEGERNLQKYALRAIANITAQLPLLVSSDPDNDPGEVKAKMFKKYFDYLANVLKRCRVLDGFEPDQRTLNVNKNLQTLLIKSKENLKDLAPLRELTMTAISNLVNANVDAGLPYCLPMAYIEDTRTKTSFLQLFTKMLEQRVDLDDLDDALPLDRIERIIEVFTSDPSFGLAISTACPANHVDAMSPALLHLYDARGLTMPFVKRLVENEINRTESYSILFRGNNAAPRIITAFIHAQSGSYLSATLGPLLSNVIQDPRLQEFSVASNIAPERRVANIQYIQTIAQSFLDAIVDSADSFPIPLREICHHIATCTATRFHGNATAPHIGVGSIVFLRFIGPAISIPVSSMQPDEDLSQGVKRALVLVTKIIQNLASNAKFTEQNMLPLNPFLQSNIKRVLEFIHIISASPPSLDNFSNSVPIVEVSDVEVLRLYDFVYNNLADVKKALFQIRASDELPEAGRARVQLLTTLTNQLGSPARKEITDGQEHHPIQISASVNIGDYNEFMERYRGKDIEMFKSADVFYLCGVSKLRRPVLCFVTRRFDFSSMDLELFTYYLCHVLESVWNSPFEIFIDITAETSANEVPVEWVTNLLRGLPRNKAENCALIYHYNVNTPYRRQLRTIIRNAKNVGFDMESRSRFIRGLEDLQRYLELTEVRLSENTVALDMQAALTFEPVWRIITRDKRSSVSIKVGQDSVQAEEQQVTSTSHTPLCDVIFAVDIDEVNVSSYISDENEFVLKGKGIRLAIQAVRAAVQERNPVPLTQRGARPGSLPGTLLNAIFLNLPSEDVAVRLASWNLLCALSKAYHLDMARQLRPAPGLFLPPHSIDLFVGLSRQVSLQTPHLSLDVIGAFLEHFQSYNPQQKEYGLLYIQPWIPQIETQLRTGSADFVETTKEIKSVLRAFIRLTYEKPQLAWYTHIWPSIGKVPELSQLLLVELFHYAVDFGFGTHQTDTAARILLSCTTIDMQGQVIARLRDSIQRIVPRPAKTLVDHPTWKEVAVLLRLCLALSFDNWQLSQQYLPEIMYVITVTAACGPAVIRSSTHAFLVNTVQSLLSHFPLLSYDRQKLETILDDLSTAKYTLLFGLSRSTPETTFSASVNSANDAVDALSITGLETIVTLLIEIMELTASTDQSNAWRSRWLSLVTSGAFRSNPAIQPRLLIALGCLADSEIDDSLLYQLVNALRNALEEQPMKDGNDMILNSLVFACTKLVGARLKPEYSGPESAYVHELFWLAVAVLEIADDVIYPLAVTFLETCLRALAMTDSLQRQHLPTYLLKSRKALGQSANALDELIGINFNRSFSFSIAALLAKGMKSQGSRKPVRSAAGLLLELSSKNRIRINEPSTALESVKPTISFEILPYLALLIPIISTSDDLAGYLTLAGLHGDEYRQIPLATVWKKLFNDGSVEEMLDNETSLLLLSLTAAILASCDREKELLLLYTFFSEAAPNTRSTFPYVYEEMVPRMTQALSTSSSIPLLETIESILCTTTSDPEFGADGVANFTHAKLLDELGFSILFKGGMDGLSKDARSKATQFAGGVAANVLSVWRGLNSS